MISASATENILSVKRLCKTYQSGPHTLEVLRDVSFDAKAGESLAIIGPSGSGKTTLLGLCAGLDTPTSGSLSLLGEELASLDEERRSKLRNQKVGFVFQNFQLIPTLTAAENVATPLELRGETRKAREVAQEWLDRVGLADRQSHYPVQLSGGEQQRVALARAFANNPRILFADEPTGNLDGETGTSVESLLFNLNRETGTTLVLVTHDLELASKAGRILKMRNGEIEEDTAQ